MEADHQALERLKELSRLIDVGEKVRETLESRGWIEVIRPMLDKMIVDVIGGKENERWHNGSLDDQRLGEAKAKELLAYKRALTDFFSYVYQYTDPLQEYQAEYKTLVSEQESSEYKEMETGYAS